MSRLPKGLPGTCRWSWVSFFFFLFFIHRVQVVLLQVLTKFFQHLPCRHSPSSFFLKYCNTCLYYYYVSCRSRLGSVVGVETRQQMHRPPPNSISSMFLYSTTTTISNWSTCICTPSSISLPCCRTVWYSHSHHCASIHSFLDSFHRASLNYDRIL